MLNVVRYLSFICFCAHSQRNRNIAELFASAVQAVPVVIRIETHLFRCQNPVFAAGIFSARPSIGAAERYHL